jgi:hypothetical protein
MKYQADITHSHWVLVEIDSEKACAAYPTERAGFDNDEDFINDMLHEIAGDLLGPDTISGDASDGIVIKQDSDDFDIHLRPLKETTAA